ncbi:DUF4828 domain-containing protein [Enterococcus faecium]|nr:DUF4828 domain-containing protein [Enterococcus faecium]
MCCGNSILQKGLPFFYLHKIFYTLITSDYTFLINGQSLGTSVVEIDEYRLVVRDQYGFYLIFSYPEQTLYDESADTSYKLLSEK